MRKILLVQSAVSRAWQHQETHSSVATCTCAEWVWRVDRWSAVTVAFDTLQLCADVNAFTRHEALWWCPEQAVGVYSLIVLILHWKCSRDLLLNHQHGSVRAGSGLDITLVYHPSPVKDVVLLLVVKSTRHALTVDINEGESEIGTMQGIHCGYMDASKRKTGNFRPEECHMCPNSKQDIKTVYCL